MPRSARLKFGASKSLQDISVGPHVFSADGGDYGGQGEMKVMNGKNTRAIC
jgi:hypothetical protein